MTMILQAMVTETEAVISEIIKRSHVLAHTDKVGGSTSANMKKVIGTHQTENVHTNFS